MKILDLKILSDNGQLQKHIEFNEKGLSVIYGNILEEGNSKQTNNSLGKTTLLKMIDYIFGAKSDKTIIKTTLKNYEIIAKVKFENRTYEVRRVINIEGKPGNFSDKIYIDDDEYKLDGYKDFFKLERKFITTQILLSQKVDPVFCNNKKPTQEDYSIFLEMLNMNSLAGLVYKLYKEQKNLQEEKSAIKKNEPKIDLKKRRDILEINKQTREQELEKARENLNRVKEQLKNLKTSEISEEMIKKRENSIEKFKKLSTKITIIEIELKKLVEYEENLKTLIEPSEIKMMFEKARVQVPDMVKKRLEEVYKFNKSISQSRLEIISKKIGNLNKDRDNFREEQHSLNKIIDEISKLLAENETYKELFTLFESHQRKLYNVELKAKLEEKTDFQIEKINEISRNIKNNLFPILETEKEKYSHLIEKYYEYMRDFTNSIYEEKPVSNFGIKVNEPHETNGAISFEIAIHQEGEGVIGSKKNIIDYLISTNTTKTQILVQDTSCFNGIDPRQVAAMIAKAGKQLYDKDKQFIVAINKYQITEEIEEIAILKDNIKLELSEEDRLFNIEF